MLKSEIILTNTSVAKSELGKKPHGIANAMAVVLLCASVNAFANDDVVVTPSKLDVNSTESSTQSSSNSSHWTLGSTLGEAKSDLTQSESGGELSATGVIASQFNVEDSRVGWKFNVGFDVTSNFAIKAGYMDLNEASNETNSAVADPAIFGYQSANKSLTNTAEGFSLGSVYRYNVTDALGFTGSVGVFNWESNLEGQSLNGPQNVGDQTGGTDIYFGLGGGYQLTDDVSLSIEWEHYKLNDENTDMLSIGVNYHFK